MNLGKLGQAEQDFSYGMGHDLLDAEKCKFWQSAPYAPLPEGKEAEFGKQAEFRKEDSKA